MDSQERAYCISILKILNEMELIREDEFMGCIKELRVGLDSKNVNDNPAA